MKHHNRIAKNVGSSAMLLLTAVFGFLFSPSPAMSQMLHFNDVQRGDTVIARFESWDAEHCVGTFTGVGAFIFDNKEQSGPFQHFDRRFVLVLKIDTCDPDFDPIHPSAQFFGASFGPLDVTISPNLSRARVFGQAQMTDLISGNTFIVPVDVTWEATSRLTVNAEPFFEFVGPPVQYAYIGHGNYRFRTAEAYGSVLVNGINTILLPTSDIQL